MAIDPNLAIGTANLLLEVTSKLLDKLPEYSQRKREHFFKLKKAYDQEINSAPKYRDDQKIDQLWDELKNFILAFNQELNKKEEEKDE